MGILFDLIPFSFSIPLFGCAACEIRHQINCSTIFQASGLVNEFEAVNNFWPQRGGNGGGGGLIAVSAFKLMCELIRLEMTALFVLKIIMMHINESFELHSSMCV